MPKPHTIAFAALLAASCQTLDAPDAEPVQSVVSHSDDAAAASPDQSAVAYVFNAFEDLERAFNPISAANRGDQSALARLPSVRYGDRQAEREAWLKLREEIDAIETVGLTAPQRINLKLLSDLLDDRVLAIGYDDDRLPFTSDWGFYSLASYAIDYSGARTPADKDLLVQRLEAMPVYLRETVVNMRRGLETDFVASRPTVEIAIATMERLDLSGLLAKFEDASADTKLRAEAALLETQKAMDEAFAFMKTEYLPAAPPLRAARDQPDGEAYYQYLITHHTGAAMTPDEIHALGLSEVARIRARMEEVIEDVGFEGTFAEFLAFLRTDPQFYAKTPAELMEKASEMAKRADGFLPQMFGKLPRLTYTVKAAPDDIAPNYTTGRYYPGSPEQGRAGIYYVNTYDLSARPLYELPSLTLHEAVPGHHLQIALSQELDDQPEFRRSLQTTAFVEGWGLYSESLGEEADFYRTPYERFGRLSYEMWRACRLVADTGFHWKRWSVDEARVCFAENSALSEHNIETELQRYLSWPGQALAYKIGEIEIHRLRAKAEAALGDDFDIRAFHDVLLENGAVPFSVVEATVDGWIADMREG